MPQPPHSRRALYRIGGIGALAGSTYQLLGFADQLDGGIGLVSRAAAMADPTARLAISAASGVVAAWFLFRGSRAPRPSSSPLRFGDPIVEDAGGGELVVVVPVRSRDAVLDDCGIAVEIDGAAPRVLPWRSSHGPQRLADLRPESPVMLPVAGWCEAGRWRPGRAWVSVMRDLFCDDGKLTIGDGAHRVRIVVSRKGRRIPGPTYQLSVDHARRPILHLE